MTDSVGYKQNRRNKERERERKGKERRGKGTEGKQGMLRLSRRSRGRSQEFFQRVEVTYNQDKLFTCMKMPKNK